MNQMIFGLNEATLMFFTFYMMRIRGNRITLSKELRKAYHRYQNILDN